MRTKIVYKLLGLSMLASSVGSADSTPNLIRKAFPKSSLTSFFNKCPGDNGKIDWSMVAQLEKMDQKDFNVDKYVSMNVMPCVDAKKDPNYVKSLKETCSAAVGSYNQINVCNAIGINLEKNPNQALQVISKANLSEKDISKLLDNAVPKPLIKCSSGGGKINWSLIKQVEGNAVDQKNATLQMANYFKERVDGCMDNKKNPNFLTTLESTCIQGVGSPQQVKICRKVQELTGRKNPVVSETDSHALQNSLQDLTIQAQTEIDTNKSQIDNLTEKLTAFETQSAADKDVIATFTAQLKEAQDKLTALDAQSNADKDVIATLTDKLKGAQDKLSAVPASDPQAASDLEAREAKVKSDQDALDEKMQQMNASMEQLQTYSETLVAFRGQLEQLRNNLLQQKLAMDGENADGVAANS